MIGIFLDSETNGLNPKTHQVVEIAFQIVDLSSGEIKEEFETLVQMSAAAWEKSDPDSLNINGFTFDEISKGKKAEVVSQTIIDIFTKWNVRRKKAVFICQNPSFDRVFFSQLIDVDTQEMLLWPYHWLDLASMHWAKGMELAKETGKSFPWETGLSKDLIAKHYKLAAEDRPHRAMNGVKHLVLCYNAVVGFPNSITRTF